MTHSKSFGASGRIPHERLSAKDVGMGETASLSNAAAITARGQPTADAIAGSR